jgi:hypothetical protein
MVCYKLYSPSIRFNNRTIPVPQNRLKEIIDPILTGVVTKGNMCKTVTFRISNLDPIMEYFLDDYECVAAFNNFHISLVKIPNFGYKPSIMLEIYSGNEKIGLTRYNTELKTFYSK